MDCPKKACYEEQPYITLTADATAATYEKQCCCYQYTKSCMLYGMMHVVKARLLAQFVLLCLKTDLESGGDVEMLLHVCPQDLIDAD